MAIEFCDAHVHMGYFARSGFRVPHYYSPRRISGILRRCGVKQFIVSSTCAQIEGIALEDLNREAMEMRRVAGSRAHVFLWVSANVLRQDRNLEILGLGLYEGLKLHEEEARWVSDRPRALERILSIASSRHLPVQFHSGRTGGCRPVALAKYARRFPDVRFDFAHCPDMSEMAKIMTDCPNVWTDTAYWPMESFVEAAGHDWHGRLLFGTDLPVWQAYEDVGLTAKYREYVRECSRADLNISTNQAFLSFVGRKG